MFPYVRYMQYKATYKAWRVAATFDFAAKGPLFRELQTVNTGHGFLVPTNQLFLFFIFLFWYNEDVQDSKSRCRIFFQCGQFGTRN